MAVAMNSASFRGIVEPVMNESFDGIYDQRKDEWKQIFSEQAGTPRAYHEEVVLHGFGAAPEIGDGAPVTFDQGGTMYIVRAGYKQYGLAFALTKVLVEDGDHIRLGTTFSKHLAQSLIETKETVLANVVNRAFNSSYVGGDGKELCSTSHPMVEGTWSNRLGTDAALSQTSLEQMLIQIRNATDNKGKKIRLEGRKLVIPTALMFQAEVLLNSTLKSGTPNNDINALKSLGLLSDGVATVSRFTSSTAWFIKTDAPEGLKLLTRRKLEKGMEGDFESDSLKYKATERYGFLWNDPRCLYGTTGV